MADEGKKIGLLTWLGSSDKAAGTARGIMMTFGLLGPIVGGVILWWINDLGKKLDTFDAKFVTLFQHIGAIEKSEAANAVEDRERDAKIVDLTTTSKNHENRITCLELIHGPCRSFGGSQ